MKTVPRKENIKRILVFRLGGIGDYVCLLPMLEDLRAHFPATEITIVASPSGKELLEPSRLVDKCVFMGQLSKQGLESVCSVEAFKNLVELRRQLEGRYDIFIDATPKYSLAGTLKPILARILASASFSIGLDYKGRGFFLDRRIPEDRFELRHVILKYADILQELGIPAGFHLAKINVPGECAAAADSFFRPFGGKLRIGIHPGANEKYLAYRAWPAAKFAELAEALSAKTGAEIFITSAPSERRLVEELKRLCRVRLLEIPAQETILGLCAMLLRLDFYVCNDTGPMHLAVAMGVPTLGIFNPESFPAYGTYPNNLPFMAAVPDTDGTYSPIPEGLRALPVEAVLEKFFELSSSCRGC